SALPQSLLVILPSPFACSMSSAVFSVCWLGSSGMSNFLDSCHCKKLYFKPNWLLVIGIFLTAMEIESPSAAIMLIRLQKGPSLSSRSMAGYKLSQYCSIKPRISFVPSRNPARQSNLSCLTSASTNQAAICQSLLSFVSAFVVSSTTFGQSEYFGVCS